MKRAALFLLILGTIASCSKDDDKQTETATGDTYKLIEVLADPGDGSGTFQPVSSNKTIEFKTNGTVVSNGKLCDMSISSNSGTTGTYSFTDSTITSANCSKLPFEITGNHLIIFYPCIEPCQGKFEKQ
ncbi:hypothetical protein [Owenweeksia hongkongensis]|uniref:hypothetical protein n=1 Tax=Owenweeksia hongkongensis TaxID=253245 RepID=UPI003A932479